MLRWSKVGARRTFIQHLGKVETPDTEAMTDPKCETGITPGRMVREFLSKQGIRPRKSLGQHFLVDSGALRRIIDAADLSSVDTVVEVGPGPGVLTRELLLRAGSVIAIEKDESIAEGLRQAYLGDPKIRILAADMLKVDPGELTGGAPYKVVANLGNEHTLAYHLHGSTILGVLEHHTHVVTPERLEQHLEELVSGDLDGEAIWKAQGHGAVVVEGGESLGFLSVIGPMRGMMQGSRLKPYFATPHGSMMLAGSFGLLRAWAEHDPSAREGIMTALSSVGENIGHHH